MKKIFSIFAVALAAFTLASCAGDEDDLFSQSAAERLNAASDWYIIRKFIGTYFFSIALIISISIVFDVNENLAKFTQYHAPLRAIVFDYYANFIPYFANLFSALFVFIAVIFFTSKMAGNSEIIAMLATGISFKRLLRPYMFTCVLLAGMSYYLSAYIIPHGTVIRQNFESLYKNKKMQTAPVFPFIIIICCCLSDSPSLKR